MSVRTVWDYSYEERVARRAGFFEIAQRWQDRARWHASMGRFYDLGHRGSADKSDSCNAYAGTETRA